MKIQVQENPPAVLKAVLRQMLKEGDTLVKEGGDLLLQTFPLKGTSLLQVAIGPAAFPDAIAKSLGFDTLPEESENVVVTRWWDRLQGWCGQLMVSLPLAGMMNGSLGNPLISGQAGRYVSETPLSDYFESASLLAFVKELRFNGPVSFSLCITDEGIRIVRLWNGIPVWGLFNAFEGWRGRLSDFLCDPAAQPLMESWSVSLLLSAYPFPMVRESEEPIVIRGLTPEVEKHFWLFDAFEHRKAVFTKSTSIGVASAWSPSLHEASRRAERTCWNLGVECKQFRTDSATQMSEEWGKLQAKGLV
jgi:hypothetical protein